jgi:radical SAM protein with 4Fe4S-binding SPASM domain
MPVAMFRNIVTFLAPTVWKLVLYNYGEPFLHRSLAECVKFAREQGIERVEISTNGNVVRAELPDLLVNSGLALLRFSIDGATQLTYERYRVGGNLQTVLNNMNSFRIARDRCGLREPVIEAQCVVNRYNELELGALCELVAAHGADRLRLKTFNALMSGSTFEELGRSFVPESKPLSRYDSPTTLLVRDEFKLSKCSWPSERIVINSNGDIVPCCYDPNGAHVLGQFRKLSMDWWETKEREAFRIRLEESAASIPMCQRCPIGVPDLRVRSNELLVEFSSI